MWRVIPDNQLGELDAEPLEITSFVLAVADNADRRNGLVYRLDGPAYPLNPLRGPRE